MPITDNVDTARQVNIYTDDSWKHTGSATVRVLLSPEETEVAQGAGIVVVSSSEN